MFIEICSGCEGTVAILLPNRAYPLAKWAVDGVGNLIPAWPSQVFFEPQSCSGIRRNQHERESSYTTHLKRRKIGDGHRGSTDFKEQQRVVSGSKTEQNQVPNLHKRLWKRQHVTDAWWEKALSISPRFWSSMWEESLPGDIQKHSSSQFIARSDNWQLTKR